MRLVVTGGDGFIGRNLRLRLHELDSYDVISVTEQTTQAAFRDALRGADLVFHLAGVNRPLDEVEFQTGNADLTAWVCEVLTESGRATPLVFTSSIQATLANPYGRSKRAAETAVECYGREGGAAVILRLPNVFGKWCRPNYNSAVATFCHNIARGLPISVHDPAAALRLVYIDDVVETMIRLIDTRGTGARYVEVDPVYDTTVGDVADMLRAFAESRHTLTIPPVGTGLGRALYATFMSYVPPQAFSYPLQHHRDARGAFVEVIRNRDAGQVSVFTARPGVTRGGHYHHTKTEKFLVVHGRARFRFRNLDTGEAHAMTVDGDGGQVVETVPGWAHDVTNVGDDEMIVLLWANEVFDPMRPDTIATSLDP